MQPTSILYVEDNDDLRESIAMALEGPAREIALCVSGEEALPLLEGRTWDILMTDVSLPGMTGIDLARRLTAVNPEQWVILCSGYDMGAQLSALGPNVRALTKPFELDALEQVLDQIENALRSR